MNSKMIGRLLLVFCAVGLSRPEHFLVETEASGEDYASAEMRKVIKIAEIHFWPKKISQKSVNFDKFDFATKHRKLPVNHKNLKNNITFVY